MFVDHQAAESTGSEAAMAMFALRLRSQSQQLQLHLLPRVDMLRSEDALRSIDAAYLAHPLHFSKTAVAAPMASFEGSGSPFVV